MGTRVTLYIISGFRGAIAVEIRKENAITCYIIAPRKTYVNKHIAAASCFLILRRIRILYRMDDFTHIAADSPACPVFAYNIEQELPQLLCRPVKIYRLQQTLKVDG